jgi:hypothetical protein
MTKPTMTVRQQISFLEDNLHRVFAVHYACQRLTDPSHGSPAVSCIAVHNLASGQVMTFDLDNCADEPSLLGKFFDFIDKNRDRFYIHWNMTNPRYGFPAIGSRYHELTGQNTDVLDHITQFDLDSLIEARFERHYIEHPKLANLSALNRYTMLDFKDGAEEARLFEQGRILDIKASTSRKVRILACILRDLIAGRILVRHSKWRILVRRIEENMWYKVLVIMAALATVGTTVYIVVRAFTSNG